MNSKPACSQHRVLVRPDQLPLSCPQDSQLLWNAHPKVYLPIGSAKQVTCPYCSTVYVLDEASTSVEE
ncbi:MAG: zinc-finger domain-containing protein [Pseudomonadota bacterium]|nr:zinc-finger domain-containing protein [Pseudomonadota bacterium]